MVRIVVMGSASPYKTVVIPGQRGSAELRCAIAHRRIYLKSFRDPGFDALRRPGMTPSASLLGLAGILHRVEFLELDVVELAIDLLDLSDVDILHDVARLRIDRDRATRAFPRHSLHGRDQAVAVGLAAGL